MRILNLDEVRLVEARLMTLQQVRDVVSAAGALSALERREEWKKQLTRLIVLARGTSEYSLAVRCHLPRA